MEKEWQVMLSYDAKSELYNLCEGIEFKSTPSFRIALIARLQGIGAEKLESYCQSTILFKMKLQDEENPLDKLSNLFSEAFGEHEFNYMAQCVLHQDYNTFGSSPKLTSKHSNNFKGDVYQATSLQL